MTPCVCTETFWKVLNAKKNFVKKGFLLVKYRHSKCPTLFQTSADTKNRSSPQVNAMLGLKFVQ
jgi:hypothetical protein